MKKHGIFDILSKAYLLIILLLIYTPIIVMIIFSFSNSNHFTFAEGFSLEGYKAIVTRGSETGFFNAIKNTLLVALISSVISTAIGAFSTIGIYYLNARTKKAVLSINQLPLINSEMVMAVSLMLFFVTLNIPFGYVTLILSHISFCTPYVVLSVLPRLKSMDPNLYEAALDLGANPFTALTKVLIPYIFPGVVSGFVMAFTLSLDDFIITQMNKGETSGIETISTLLYKDAKVGGLEVYWFPVFSIIFVVVLSAILISNVIKSKSQMKEHI